MVKKMQCYTIINVITSDKEAIYDVEDFALDVPVPSTGWLRMGENCSYYPIKPKDEVSIFIKAGKDRMKFNALSARLDRGGSMLVVRKRKARQCRRFLEYSHNVTI